MSDLVSLGSLPQEVIQLILEWAPLKAQSRLSKTSTVYHQIVTLFWKEHVSRRCCLSKKLSSSFTNSQRYFLEEGGKLWKEIGSYFSDCFTFKKVFILDRYLLLIHEVGLKILDLSTFETIYSQVTSLISAACLGQGDYYALGGHGFLWLGSIQEPLPKKLKIKNLSVVQDLCFLNDNHWLAYSIGTSLCILDSVTGEQLYQIDSEFSIKSMAFCDPFLDCIYWQNWNMRRVTYSIQAREEDQQQVLTHRVVSETCFPSWRYSCVLGQYHFLGENHQLLSIPPGSQNLENSVRKEYNKSFSIRELFSTEKHLIVLLDNGRIEALRPDTGVCVSHTSTLEILSLKYGLNVIEHGFATLIGQTLFVLARPPHCLESLKARFAYTKFKFHALDTNRLWYFVWNVETGNEQLISSTRRSTLKNILPLSGNQFHSMLSFGLSENS